MGSSRRQASSSASSRELCAASLISGEIGRVGADRGRRVAVDVGSRRMIGGAITRSRSSPRNRRRRRPSSPPRAASGGFSDGSSLSAAALRSVATPCPSQPCRPSITPLRYSSLTRSVSPRPTSSARSATGPARPALLPRRPPPPSPGAPQEHLGFTELGRPLERTRRRGVTAPLLGLTRRRFQRVASCSSGPSVAIDRCQSARSDRCSSRAHRPVPRARAGAGPVAPTRRRRAHERMAKGKRPAVVRIRPASSAGSSASSASPAAASARRMTPSSPVCSARPSAAPPEWAPVAASAVG